MSVSRRTALAGGLAALLAGCSSGGYSGPEPASGTVRIAAGEHGGLYLAFAQLLASALHGTEPRLRCLAVSTQGSVGNIGLVAGGRADLGLTLADAAEAAVAASPPFPHGMPLRALGQVYENYLQLIVRADGSVRRLDDLAGRPVSLGAARSGAAVEGARLVAASGVPMRVEHLLLADAIAALESGRIDALLWSGGIPTPAITRLSARTPISLLPLDGVLPAMRTAYGPVYAPARLPSAAYAGVGTLPTIGVANLLVCAPDLPDAVAELVVRVLVRQAARLEPAQAVGTQFLDVRTLIDTGTVPLHPGAVAAYRSLHG